MKWFSLLVLAILASCSPGAVGRPPATPTFFHCEATPYLVEGPPDAYVASFTTTWYGNGSIWAGLDRAYHGSWYAGGVKVLWYRTSEGPLSIEGTRLDGPSEPLRADIPQGYGQIGIQASGIDFPSEGCWQVTGKVGEHQLIFIVQVLPAAENPVSQ